MARGVVAGETGRHGLPISSKLSDFWKFNASSENVLTFACSIERGFEFFRKVIELRSSTLEVPRSGATTPLRMAP